METAAQKAARTVININWFVFGAAFLSLGMFVITGVVGWAWLGFVVVYLFGLTSAAVWGAKAIVERENT